jgi:hypothetical protein
VNAFVRACGKDTSRPRPWELDGLRGSG